MWNGSRSGPGGGMPFRGDPRGEMFNGRNGPMPGFRGREGMNMGAGPHDRPPMDMRRFDCPPDMMGRNMGLERGRERDFFRPGNELNMNFRRPFGVGQNAAEFMGQGRPPMGMGGRDMQGRNMRGPEDQCVDMRERDRFRGDLPGFNMSPMDGRRRMAMESMNKNDNLQMSQRGMNDIDGFSMNMPPQDRSNMDMERRHGPPPPNPRERFESDTDFRNRMGSQGDFRGRPPQILGDSDGTPMNVRGRPAVTPDRQGPEKPTLKLGEPTLRDREFPEQIDNPSGFRGEDGKSLTEEWCRRDTAVRDSLSPMMNRTSSVPMKDRFLLDKEGDLGGPSQFKETEWKTMEFKDRDALGFSGPERKGSTVQKWDSVPSNFPIGDALRAIQKPQLLPLDPPLSRNNDGKPWTREDKPNLFSVDQAAVKGKAMLFDEEQKKGNLIPGPREPQINKAGKQDQDYRDIDYRTSSGQKYDYVLESLQGPEKNVKEPKVALLERPTSSGSRDQDYRSAGVQDQISNTIAVSEIPKTATMQQILDAFAVRNGVPMQGMKIRNVVPGYSSDTAYVEFLNLEDAVHFMESNQGSVKVGSNTALLKYIRPGRSENEQQRQDPPPKATPTARDGLLPLPVMPILTGTKADGCAKPQNEPLSQIGWQRNSNLTPEAWQQQVDKQLQQQEKPKMVEELANQKGSHPTQPHSDLVLQESKTMIIKNLLPTTTLETVLKALDPFAYLDERNVRLVKGKTPGSKCFCFVDMDSHQQVVRLVELLTKPRQIMIDKVRVFAEVAKPLKNQNYRKDQEKSNTSLLGLPPDVMEQQYYLQSSHTAMSISAATQGACASTDLMHATGADSAVASATLQSPSLTQIATYSDVHAVEPSIETTPREGPSLPDPGLAGPVNSAEVYNFDTDTPDLTAFLYDATSGFYYDPQTTLYYDPNSRYFYNAQTQQYLYWDSTSKAYVPVEGSSTNVQELNAPPGTVPDAVAVEEQKAPLEGAADQREDEDANARSEKKDKDKEERPKSLAAFKIMKDMERWAKIQNRQKDSVRSPSPLLKSAADDKKASKAADAAFAVFERKGTGGDDLFKKPLAPVKKEEKGPKRPMGSLGMLAADYGAGSDDEEEDKHEKNEAAPPVAKSQPQSEEKDDKLTDWKKMACLLCRRQFPNKDALVRHQLLSDLHKQNMEIHLKIKKSKKELEALETQEKEMKMREANSPPNTKRRKQDTWGSSSRDTHKGNERPGLGMDTTERKKKEPTTWNYATYKQAVRKAMFARFKELD